MSSPRERSEARRKALLSKGSDRLKKLTSSARGEDAPQFAYGDPPLTIPLNSFIGESTHERSQISDTVWTPDEHRRAMEGLNIPRPSLVSETTPPIILPPETSIDAIPHDPQMDMAHPSTPGRPSSLNQKLTSLAALLLPAFVLLYFIVLYEPSLYQSYPHIGSDHWTVRWSNLGIRGTDRAAQTEGVHSAPFFTAFITLQLIQQISTALLFPVESGIPKVFGMVLPHLPKTIQRWIIQLLFFIRVLSSLLDQTAIVVFVIGLVIWVAGFFSMQ